MALLDMVHAYIDLERYEQSVPIGALHRQQSRAGEIFSFEYDRTWLERPEAFAFDPDLVLATGHQYPAADRKISGSFSTLRPTDGDAF